MPRGIVTAKELRNKLVFRNVNTKNLKTLARSQITAQPNDRKLVNKAIIHLGVGDDPFNKNPSPSDPQHRESIPLIGNASNSDDMAGKKINIQDLTDYISVLSGIFSLIKFELKQLSPTSQTSLAHSYQTPHRYRGSHEICINTVTPSSSVVVSAYAKRTPRDISSYPIPTRGMIIERQQLIDVYDKLEDQIRKVNTVVVPTEIPVCHCNCHNNCHWSRGRR